MYRFYRKEAFDFVFFAGSVELRTELRGAVRPGASFRCGLLVVSGARESTGMKTQYPVL